MGKIAKKSLHKSIISKGGGVVHWRPQVDHGHPQERGEAYIVPAGGGARLCAPLEKKFCYMLGIFITFLYVGGGGFLLRFSLCWGSQGTDARTGGGG